MPRSKKSYRDAANRGWETRRSKYGKAGRKKKAPKKGGPKAKARGPKKKKPAIKKTPRRSRQGARLSNTGTTYCTIGKCTRKPIFGGEKGRETHMRRHHRGKKA